MSLDMPSEEKSAGKSILSREDIIGAAPIKKEAVKPTETGKIYLAHKRINLPVQMQKKMEEIAKERGLRYFTALLKQIFEEYLENPIDHPKFKLIEIDDTDGIKKNRDVRLPPQMIEDIQKRADLIFGGNFSGLAQEIVKGWLAHNQ